MSAAAATSARDARKGGLMLDPLLLLIVLSILLLGLVMVASASISIASQHGGDPFSYVKSQLLLVTGGMTLALLLSMVPTELYEKHANLLLIAAAVLLIAVLVPGLGHVVKGSRRWVRLGVFNLQASEAARVLVLCWISAYSVRRAEELRTTFGGLARPLLIVAGFCALLLLEPDFGAATVLFATAFGVLFLAGARLRWVLLCVLGAGSVFGLLMVSAGYRMRRITSFLDPWAHAYDSGFQLTQSLIAIGRGEWFGVGLGESVQKLFYLPEAHTDFLFAVLAEELGLMGVVATLALFLLLAWRVLYIARLAADAGMAFQAALAASFGLWVGVQSLINIGVNMGVLPTKGLTLPLMSYGRSSMLVTLASLGLVLRVYHEAMTRTRGSASAGTRRAPVAEGRGMSAPPVMIMAGGTGGHVFPALALARLLRAQRREVIWLGTRRGLEARVVPADGFAIEWLSVGGLRGKSALTLLAAPFRVLRALWQALTIMRRHRPAVVVGLGGFVTGPGGVAAWLMRRPLLVHEQNAVAGFTNRCLAPLAREVLTAFPAAFAGKPHVRMIGNPVRADIAALAAPAQRFAQHDGALRLLVIGGSLGARRLNEVVPQALALLAKDAQAPRFSVRHQAGEKLIDAARAAYAQAGVVGEVSPFIADMAEALAWADLVVCRAGALTIAELAAAGIGAVLVPFPHAVDDHQTFNAQYLVEAGAARCYADSALTPMLLAATLTELCATGRDGLLRLAEAARAVAKPRAAQDLLDAVLAAEDV